MARNYRPHQDNRSDYLYGRMMASASRCPVIKEFFYWNSPHLYYFVQATEESAKNGQLLSFLGNFYKIQCCP